MIDTSRTKIDRPFAGAVRPFQLRYGEIETLERMCGAGIGEIMMRLAGHRFRAADIWQTIRLGLEGGGASEPEATALVLPYRETALSAHLQLAADILTAAVSGVEVPEGNGEEAGSIEPETSPQSIRPEHEPA